MDSQSLKGSWKRLKGEVRRQWGKLTDDDLDVVRGDAEVLIGKVQERYGRRKDEAEREVHDWIRDLPDDTTRDRGIGRDETRKGR